MAAHGFKQEPHKLLVIPGPIEVSDEVLYANAHPSMSHMSPDFSAAFKYCLDSIKKVLLTTAGQPFITAGSGTLGWDMVAANLLESGDKALVLNSGYFGDSFAECIEAYGGKVTQVKAPVVGDSPRLEDVEAALKKDKYKILTVTHVDTSTGVLADAKAISEVVKRVSPDTLIILDGVCSVGSEEIRFDEWGIDVVLAASQKGLGVPPGLCILMASPHAIKVFESRRTPVPAYFASWSKWLPVMRAYQSGSAAYFATPPVNLLYALQASLQSITERSPTLEERFAMQKEASKRLKGEIEKLGLKQVPVKSGIAANGMTAVYAPDGIKPTDIVPKMLQKNIVVAAGLHKEIKDKYFRIGTMGITVVNPERGDLDKIIAALKESLAESGYKAPGSSD